MRRLVAFVLFASFGWLLCGLAPALGASGPEEVPYSKLSGSRIEIFMNVRATRADVARVRATIRRDPQIRQFAFLDRHDALLEFRRIFRRNAQLRRGVKASDLPLSFRIRVRDGHLDAVVARYQRLPGVDVVTGAAVDASRGWGARVACSRTAYDLEVVMQDESSSDSVAAVVEVARRAPGVEHLEIADAVEVQAIRDCLDGHGEHELSGARTLIHIDVTDPGAASTLALRSQIGGMAGVDAVHHDPSLAETS